MQLWCYRLTFASLIILSLGIFTSVSVTALSHVLVLVPGIYFAIKFYKERPFKLSKSFWALAFMVVSIILSVVFNFEIIDRPLKNILKAKYFVLPMISVFAYYYTFKNYMTDKRKSLLLYLFIGSTTLATLSGIIGLPGGCFSNYRFQ